MLYTFTIVVKSGEKCFLQYTMYIGQYNHFIDIKNRLFLPITLRKKSKVFFVAQGLEECLYLYDLSNWEKLLLKLDTVSLPSKTEERAFKRALLSGAFQTSVDPQGRILIPKNLKEYAQLKSEAVIIGVGTRIEVWDAVKWRRYFNKEAKLSFKKLAEKLEI